MDCVHTRRNRRPQSMLGAKTRKKFFFCKWGSRVSNLQSRASMMKYHYANIPMHSAEILKAIKMIKNMKKCDIFLIFA